MEDNAGSSPSASPDPDSTARRSRSGRVVKAPTKFAPEATGSSASKRKRDDQDGDDAEDADPPSEDDVSDEPDADSDDDHPAPRSRKPSQGARPKKPSSKKPRINGAQPVASGHVARIPSRPKKTVRIDAGEKGTGLFGRWKP